MAPNVVRSRWYFEKSLTYKILLFMEKELYKYS